MENEWTVKREVTAFVRSLLRSITRNRTSSKYLFKKHVLSSDICSTHSLSFFSSPPQLQLNLFLIFPPVNYSNLWEKFFSAKNGIPDSPPYFISSYFSSDDHLFSLSSSFPLSLSFSPAFMSFSVFLFFLYFTYTFFF